MRVKSQSWKKGEAIIVTANHSKAGLEGGHAMKFLLKDIYSLHALILKELKIHFKYAKVYFQSKESR